MLRFGMGGMKKKRNQKNLTLAELGRRLGLSHSAVAQSLDDMSSPSSVRVSAKTRARVRALAKKLNYRRSRTAQVLRTGKSQLVGLMTNQNFGHVSQEYMHFARLEAIKRGLVPTVIHLRDSTDDGVEQALHFIIDMKLDAVVAFSATAVALSRRISELSTPFVAIGMPLPAKEISQFYSNKVKAHAELATHLIEQGARRIILMHASPWGATKSNWHLWSAEAGTLRAVTLARKRGVKAELEIFECDDELSRHLRVPGPPEIHGLHAPGYFAMRQLLERDDLPDALCCESDYLALGAIQACTEVGVRVPDDLLVAGFEDAPFASSGAITITSARQNREELCRLAFNEIDVMLTGQKAQGPKRTVIPCEIIIRGSSRRTPGQVPKNSRPQAILAQRQQ